jgi:TonB family protein
VSDPEESEPFANERSTLVSMGSRRFWFFRSPDPGRADPAPSLNGDSPQIFHSMLGDLASHAGDRPMDAGDADASPQIFHSMLDDLAGAAHVTDAEAAAAVAAGRADAAPPHSMLSLDGAAERAAAVARRGTVEGTASVPPTSAAPRVPAAAAPPVAAASPVAAAPRSAAGPRPDSLARAIGAVRVGATAPPPRRADEIPVPLTQHSTIAELAGLEEHVSRAFPIERAILISLVAHLALVILLLVAPGRSANPQGNLIDMMAAAMQTPKDDTPIPAYFTEAPGAPRPNPNRSPLSDADRRAGGGDPAKPKAAQPFVPRSRGIEGLAPGPRAPRIAGSPGAPAAPRSAPKESRSPADAAAENRAALEKSDPSAPTKPSEFPTDTRPQFGGGEPKEVVKLTRNELDQAIRDAARGTLGSVGGGENGAPLSNEDGGFVDVGGLSFETSWYDWGPYAAEMLRRIKLHWKISRDLIILQQRGTVQISFAIMADGSVTDVKVLRPSTIPPYTHAAAQAILESDPFRPLPKDLLRLVPGKDRERIVIHFIYFPTPEEIDGRHEENGQ